MCMFRVPVSQKFTTHCYVSGDQRPDIEGLQAHLRKLETELSVVCRLDEVTATVR